MSSYIPPRPLMLEENIYDYFLLDCSFSTKVKRTSNGMSVLNGELTIIHSDCLKKIRDKNIPYLDIIIIAFNSDNVNTQFFTKGIYVNIVRVKNPDLSCITEEKKDEEEGQMIIEDCMELITSDISTEPEQFMSWEEYSNGIIHNMAQWMEYYCTEPWLTFDVIINYLKTNIYDRNVLISITMVTDGVMSQYYKRKSHKTLTDEFKFFFEFLENYSYIFRLIIINIKVSLSESEEKAVLNNKNGIDVYKHIESAGALGNMTYCCIYDKDFNFLELLNGLRFQSQHVRWNGEYFNINEPRDIEKLFDSVNTIVSTIDETQQSSLVSSYITMILDITKNCSDIEKKARIRMCFDLIINFSRKVLMDIAQGVKNETVFLKDRYLAKQDFFKNTTNSLMKDATGALTLYIPTNMMVWLCYDKQNRMFMFGIIRSEMIDQSIMIGSAEYKNAACKFTITVDDHEETKYFLCIPNVTNFEDNEDTICQYQAIRQWVRDIISIYFQVNPYSDLVIFIWMFLNMMIQNSEASDIIKETFKNITLILLSKESNDKQSLLTNLVNGGMITVYNPDSLMIVEALMIIQEIFGFTSENCLEPMTIWLILCSCLDYRNLMDNQRKWSHKGLQLDHEKYGIEEIEEFVRYIMEVVRIEIIEVNSSSFEYYYMDNINFVDTSATGGYILETHGHGCRYLCVTTQETVELLDRCPWCRMEITISDWTRVEPIQKLDILISSSMYNTNEFSSLNIKQATPVLPYTEDKGILVNKSYRSHHHIRNGEEESKGSSSSNSGVGTQDNIFFSSSSVMNVSRNNSEPKKPTKTKNTVISTYKFTSKSGITIENLTINDINSSMGPTCNIMSYDYANHLTICTAKRPYTIKMIMLLWEHLVKTNRTNGTHHLEVKAFNYAKLYGWEIIENNK